MSTVAEPEKRVWNKVEIQSLLASNDEAVYRAVLRIYERQTADEQSLATTQASNGVGFTAFDANMLTSFAKQIITHQKGKSAYFSPLSPKQFEIARRRMKKYWKQLLAIANQE